MEFTLHTPVVFCTFNRLDTAQRVFERIREAKPQKLYLISDCAREHVEGEADRVLAVREYIEQHIDWDCHVEKNYAKRNMGCGRRISSGLTWVFEREEEAIILEDDCVPELSFFRYCQEMLAYHRENTQIAMISGNNPMSACYTLEEEYTFSKVPFIWGWATWRRAWQKYDFDMSDYPLQKQKPVWKKTFPLKAYWVYMAEFDALYRHEFDTWDYQWMYTIIKENWLAVVPAESHVFNIGFQEESTHTSKTPGWLIQDVKPVRFPIKHPAEIKWDNSFDMAYMNRVNRHGLIVKVKSMLGLDVNQSIVEKMLKRK